MTVWYEIVVNGPENAVRGFVAGYETSLGGTEAVIHGRDLDLEESRFSQRLRDLVDAGSHHLIFAPARLARDLVAAVEGSAGESGLAVESLREVVLVRLRFSATAFSPDASREIREKLLSGLPPGVNGENIEEREEFDPAARGVELYTPEHAYVYRVSGAFAGPLPGVFEMQRRARNVRFVKVKPLELETRPVDAAGNPGG